MNYEKEAKKIADKLLKGVGLTPELGERDLLDMQAEESGDYEFKVNGVTYMKFGPRMVGVPSGTLVPTTCSVLFRDTGMDETHWRWGILLGPVAMVLADGKRRFWVELPKQGGGKFKVQALPEHIELTHMQVDWGNTPRTRLP